MNLKEKKCKPCSGEEKPLKGDEINVLFRQLEDGWEVVDDKKLRKKFLFDNFRKSMEFAGKIAGIAEEEDHHPDLCIHYSNVEVVVSTHKIGGLSENDFILASRIDNL
jgi:4a-hydroxytetrahydrobiopterin dehydratase